MRKTIFSLAAVAALACAPAQAAVDSYYAPCWVPTKSAAG